VSALAKRLLEFLKALPEYHDMSLGDLPEAVVLHAFDGKMPYWPGIAQADPRLEDVLRRPGGFSFSPTMESDNPRPESS
jgi:hypothetical protein